jgi:8-oxo-dGTP pyrophosphatase MutT (NUDIX family)
MIDCNAFLGGIKQMPAEKLIFRPSVYGLILDSDRLLLGYISKTGKYCLPGGAVELGEPLEAALQREIKEETGLEVATSQFLGFKEDFFYYDPLDEGSHCFLFFYYCRPLSLDLIPDDQIADAVITSLHWVPLATLHPDQFQSHGDLILKLLNQFNAA